MSSADPHAARHRRTLASRRKLSSRQPDYLANQLSSLSSYTTIRVASSNVVDFSGLALKRDHSRRPYWVTPVGRIFLEASSPLYSQARDFLIAICEPVSRPEMIHEYRLDKNALFAAASMGMTGDMIIQALNRMSKVPVAESVADFVRDWTSGYGKVKLVLRRGRFYIESSYPAVLRLLNKHPTIRASRVRYLVDGTRVVGLDGEDASRSSALGTAGSATSNSIDLTNDGFTVERALTETDASLGLGGVLSRRQEREALPRFGGQSTRAKATDTQSGTLAGRIHGEVESEDEGGGADLQGDLEGEEAVAFFDSKKSGSTATLSSSSSSWNAAVGRTGGSSSSSSAAAALQGDWDSLSSAELAAMLAAVEQAEAQYEERQRQELAARLLREEQAAKTKAMLLRDSLGTRAITKNQAGTSSKSTAINRSGTSASTGNEASVPLKRRRKKSKETTTTTTTSSSEATALLSKADTSDSVMIDGNADGQSSSTAVNSNVFTTRSGLVFASVDTVPKSEESLVDGDLSKSLNEGHSSENVISRHSTVPPVAVPTSSVVRSAAVYAAAMASAGLETDTSDDENNDPAESEDSDFESEQEEEVNTELVTTFTSMTTSASSSTSFAVANLSKKINHNEDMELDVATIDDQVKNIDDNGEHGEVAEEEIDDDDIGFSREKKKKRTMLATSSMTKKSKSSSIKRRKYALSSSSDEDDDEDDEQAPSGATPLEALQADAERIIEEERRKRKERKGEGEAASSQIREFNESAAQLQAHSMQQSSRVESFEIDGANVDEIRRLCLHMVPPLPMMQEYDFRHDHIAVPPLLDALGASGKPAVIRDTSLLRPYQEKSLSKMFGNGRARSGMIVLPCGAGKTFVGIAACITVGKSCMVLCPNTTSVNQWVDQFVRFSTVPRELLIPLTSKNKKPLPPRHVGCVLLSTYTMIGSGGGRRSKESEALLREISTREWGLQLLDEVHQAVANTFSRVLKMRCHCRLGLTATLVREDGRDADLSYLIGPKLYEANWMDLTRDGHLANVQVSEVWCPMTPEFYREYLRGSGMNRKKALSVMNPSKAWAMDFIIKTHEARGDKIIVFSESIFALQLYAKAYGAIVLTGDTPQRERDHFIHAFRTSDDVNKMFLSKVGDVALDVPDANVIVQISSHFGSRLQEAQRMGRILRRGTRSNASSSGSQSFFYSLISTDTMEMYFANKRRRYLVDQGYAYKVVPAWPGLAPTQEALCDGARLMRTQEDRNAVLTQVLLSNIDDIEAREDRALRSFIVEDDDTEGIGGAGGSKAKAGRSVTFNATEDDKHMSGSGTSLSSSALPEGVTLRSLSSMAALSGADGIRYLEFTSEKTSKDLIQQEKVERRAEEGKVFVAKRKPIEKPF
jgi:DNA repair helicase Rad25